jgi:hypothetical protein
MSDARPDPQRVESLPERRLRRVVFSEALIGARQVDAERAVFLSLAFGRRARLMNRDGALKARHRQTVISGKAIHRADRIEALSDWHRLCAEQAFSNRNRPLRHRSRLVHSANVAQEHGEIVGRFGGVE